MTDEVSIRIYQYQLIVLNRLLVFAIHTFVKAILLKKKYYLIFLKN